MPRANSSALKRAAPAAAPPPPDITTYPNAIKYLFDRADIERQRAVTVNHHAFKLERMVSLLEELGNPHHDIRTIHVAGTVGKGSTVAMIASMLRGCGYAVGEYTSPHLVDVRERILINGQMIRKQEMTDHLAEVARAASKAAFEPTFFEIITAVAFRHFARQAVDMAVIEVGLGGRLDCTNVITPEMSIITTIDYDHMHLLGRTLAEIAREKAGIFKPGVPAFGVEQSPEVEQALREVAAKVGAPLKFVNKEIEFSTRFVASPDRGPHSQVCLFTDSTRFEHVPVPLNGEHQALNCGVALAAIDHLRSKGEELPEISIHKGLATTRVPGRMELVWTKPRVLVDGAHNPAAVGALMRSVGAHVPYDSMVCIFGCCEDKDVSAMLDRLALGADKVIFTRASGIPRAANPDDLQQRFNEKSGKMNQVARTVGDALKLASRAIQRDDLIVVTGSFYLVGETKKYLGELEKKK